MPFGLNIRKKSSQATKQSKKQDDNDKEKSTNEINQLQTLIAEKDKQISDLKINVEEARKSLENLEDDKTKLSSTLSAVTVELEHAQKINEKFAESHTDMEQEIAKLKRQLDSQSQSDDVLSKLEEDLEKATAANKRLTEELHDKDNVLTKHFEEMDQLRDSLSASHHNTSELEKGISELRSERNQKEARVLQVEKELGKFEAKWKESEVEMNRNRQSLTDYKQKCSTLTDQIENIRKTNVSLTTKLKSSCSSELIDVERSRVESMKKQLERLCLHIEQSEQKYIDTISVYRSHLLKAASGNLNPQVASALREIQRLSPNSDDSRPSSSEE